MFDDQKQPSAPNNLPFGAPQSPFVPASPQSQSVATPTPVVNQPVPQPMMTSQMPSQTSPSSPDSDEDMFVGIDPVSSKPNPQTFYQPVPQQTQNPFQSASQVPVQQPMPAYAQSEGDIFGGKAFPWGKVVTVLIIVLVLVGGAGAVYWGYNYFSNSSKNLLPAIMTPTGTDNNVPAVTPTATSVEPIVTIDEPQILPEDKDTDGDGLSDLEEAKLGTDVLKADSDSDGLTDFAEVKIYQTDPLKSDTDGDGFSDGDEVKNGYDPTKSGGAKLFEIPTTP